MTVYLPDPLEQKQADEEVAEPERTIEEERKEDLKEYVKQKEADPEPVIEITEQKEEPLTEPEEEVSKAADDSGDVMPLIEPPAHKSETTEEKEERLKKYMRPGAFPINKAITTIRLNLEDFEAYLNKKFYLIKIDDRLFFEINADNEQGAIDSMLNFIETELPGLLLGKLESALDGELSAIPMNQLVTGGKNDIALNLRREDIEVKEFIPQGRNYEDEYRF